MVDMTLCVNIKCPMKEGCYRFQMVSKTSGSQAERQSFSWFECTKDNPEYFIPWEAGVDDNYYVNGGK